MKTLTEKDWENYNKAEARAYKLDLNCNSFPIEAFCELDKLDNTLVGTMKYLGVTYYHGCDSDYKWFFRAIRVTERRKIHQETLKGGFAKNEKTMIKFWERQGPKQNAIIRKVMGKKRLETFCQAHRVDIDRHFSVA
jgi:hypothetical protein